MRALKSIISSSIARHGLEKQVVIARMLLAARKIISLILDDPCNTLAEPLYFKNSILTIRCNQSAAAQELKLHESELISGLHRRFPGMSIKCVHIIC